MASHLAGRYRCAALDARGHGDSGSPASGAFWRGFAEDVLAASDALGGTSLVGAGHSFGGAALLMAEQARPGTFAALWCFEPIILPPGFPPEQGPDNRLAQGALKRREVFGSRQEAYENYASKPPLEVLDPEALRAYVDFGFEDLPDGTVRLKCRAAHEAAVFAQAPDHDAYAHLGQVSCPVTLVCGELTDSIGPELLAHLAMRLPRARSEVSRGLGHFGPLQDPAAAASSVVRALGTPSA